MNAPIANRRERRGVVFDSYKTVINVIANTSTSTGINVIVRMNDKVYKIGEKIDKKQIEWNRITE